MQTPVWNHGRGIVDGGEGDGGGGSHARPRKRTAEESHLSDNERFAKRFNLLNIAGESNANSNYYIPVPTQAPAPASAPIPSNRPVHGRTTPNDDLMQVESTRDRVYIHNLDEELESDEEEPIIFLPDIEKKLSRIPQHVLTGHRADDHEGQELVLYSLPKSLTVDERQDSVRKAILETRQRARERAVQEARQLDMDNKYGVSSCVDSTETAHGYSGGYEVTAEADVDAMEMD